MNPQAAQTSAVSATIVLHSLQAYLLSGLASRNSAPYEWFLNSNQWSTPQFSTHFLPIQESMKGLAEPLVFLKHSPQSGTSQLVPHRAVTGECLGGKDAQQPPQNLGQESVYSYSRVLLANRKTGSPLCGRTTTMKSPAAFGITFFATMFAQLLFQMRNSGTGSPTQTATRDNTQKLGGASNCL